VFGEEQHVVMCRFFDRIFKVLKGKLPRQPGRLCFGSLAREQQDDWHE
jgi:hypothetical protein